MSVLGQQFYAPVLRMKKGEYNGLAALHPEVANKIIPHLIIPPPEEPDKELGRELSEAEVVSYAGARIGRFWPRKPALIDTRFLLSKINATAPELWLPELFRTAIAGEGCPIPIATLRDLEGPHFQGFAKALEVSGHELALRLTLANLGDERISSRIQMTLLKIGLKPQQCILILDFSDVDFSEKEIVADQYQLYLDQLFDVGLWSRVVFEGTTFPESNPAPIGGFSLIDRNDWFAWKLAADANPLFKAQTMFGDFGADSALFKFGKSNARAIRHYRYSTSKHWFVVRASSSGSDKILMRDVSKRIVESGNFSGRDFSLGDKFIDDCANASGTPGNSTTWREVNTCHHLSQVVYDLSLLHGLEFSRRLVGERAVQPQLL